MRAPVVAATFFSLLLLAATNAWSVEDKEDGQEDLDRAIGNGNWPPTAFAN